MSRLVVIIVALLFISACGEEVTITILRSHNMLPEDKDMVKGLIANSYKAVFEAPDKPYSVRNTSLHRDPQDLDKTLETPIETITISTKHFQMTEELESTLKIAVKAQKIERTLDNGTKQTITINEYAINYLAGEGDEPLQVTVIPISIKVESIRL